MSLDYDLLKALHLKLRLLTDIDEQVRKGPIKVKVVKSNEAGFLAALDEAKENLLATRKSCKEKQMQLGEREAKIEDLKGKLNACDSNKEFQLLKDRIAADTQANSVLEDEIFELLERLDVLQAAQEEAQKNHTQSQTDTQAIVAKVKAELQELESEKVRISGELAEAEKGIPFDLIGEYKRLVKGKGEDALGSTDTSTCGNCNQQISKQFVSELMLRKAVFCQGCGCLMYLADGYASARS